MSLTLLIWIALFISLAVLAFKRPAYGVALYMLTFFLCPPFWWWGGPVASYRWNLYGGVILLISVIVSRINNQTKQAQSTPPLTRFICWSAILILINATAVHVALADSWEISGDSYFLLAKFILLFFLISLSIQNKWDLRIILLSIALGAGYLGYEVTVNERGQINGNRLEGVGVPAASTANGLACMMVTVLPIAGCFFLVGNRWEKLLMIPIAPMILNVILLCNSRGAFLALILTAITFLIMSPRGVRKKVLKLMCLGAVATWLLLGDPRIVERFMTTFVSAEERDSSAAGRLEFWSAATNMIADYPLGAGGHAFKNKHGIHYLEEIGIYEARSIHNGYLNEACQWGIQGMLLRIGLFITSIILLKNTAKSGIQTNSDFHAVISTAILAGIVGMMLQSMFGTFLASEWGYWMVALAVGAARAYSSETLQSIQAGQAMQSSALHLNTQIQATQ